jgi:hypothetical protein
MVLGKPFIKESKKILNKNEIKNLYFIIFPYFDFKINSSSKSIKQYKKSYLGFFLEIVLQNIILEQNIIILIT